MLWQFSHLYATWSHILTCNRKKCYTDYFLCRPNLHISIHYQCDILWHNSTNYKELLFSSDILAGAFCYMWNWFSVVVFQVSMVTWRRGRSEFSWCSGIPQIWLIGGQVIWGYTWSEHMRMSRWPYVVLLLATRCHTRVHTSKKSETLCL